ncbi:MAG: hypothetical protein NDI67_05450 [Sulfuritalea sp.]|nr:hypothetical protein [Sulfuritalea sp.]
MTSTALTVKQARFCDEHVVCGNAAAARAAEDRERSANTMKYDSTNLAIIGYLGAQNIHGVQGVASSNPAAPTSNTKGFRF